MSPGSSATTDHLVLACARSPLAIARAEAVARDLRRAWPLWQVDVAPVPAHSPAGVPGHEGATGVASVRMAVLGGRADVAVLSATDLPAGRSDSLAGAAVAGNGRSSGSGLVVGAVPQRDDPRDAMVSAGGKVLAYLHEGARIGAGTAGRAAQLLRRRRDLSIADVEGDVHARLARLSDLDAVVLSAAVLDALGLNDRVTEYFDTDQLIPAPGQGALLLEHRADDRRAAHALAPIDDDLSRYAVTAERTCLARLGAAPGVPVGIFAVTDGERMFIHGIVSSDDGSRSARLRWTGPWSEPEEVGTTLAELLLSAGAREILSGEPMPPTIDYVARRQQYLSEHPEAAEDPWTFDEPYPPEER